MTCVSSLSHLEVESLGFSFLGIQDPLLIAALRQKYHYKLIEFAGCVRIIRPHPVRYFLTIVLIGRHPQVLVFQVN
jgi:hypothetical protein